MQTITVVNNVVGNLSEIKVYNPINLDHLAKAFDMGQEIRTLEREHGIAIFYTNGHITVDG